MNAELSGFVDRIRTILRSFPGLVFTENARPEPQEGPSNGPSHDFLIQTTAKPPLDFHIIVYHDGINVEADTAEARLEDRGYAEWAEWVDAVCQSIRALLANDLRLMLYREAGTPRAIWFPGPEPGGGAWNGYGGPFGSDDHERITTLKNWHGGLHGDSARAPASGDDVTAKRG